jgi:predicted TIM-barrel fold metal-dependent hydrolase
MASRERSLISADAHWIEPPGWWKGRLPRELEPLAPRLGKDEDGGDAWIFGDVVAPIGIYCAAGKAGAWKWTGMTFDTVDPGFFSGPDRLRDMDEDGVDAEVVFPTGRTLFHFTSHESDAFHLAGVRAYNDALLEFCRADPSRLVALAALPRTRVADAVEEMRRCVALGHRGVVMLGFPSNHDHPHPDDEPVWDAAEELGVPVHIHVRLVPRDTRPKPKGKQGGDLTGLSTVGLVDMPTHIADLIFAGVCERHPELRFVAAEAGAGWVPYLLEQMDDRWWRNRQWAETRLSEPPSFYFRRNWLTTFMTDAYAVRNRHAIGIENVMWTSDFPHHGCEWPLSRKVIDGEFADVPVDERRTILAGNAERLYGLDRPAAR